MPSSQETRQRQERALSMRDNGNTYDTIAAVLNYAHAGAARRAVLTAMIRAGRENEIAEGRAITLRSGRTTRTVVVPTLEGFHTTSQLTFGIEIECIGLSHSGVVRALQANNIVCVDAGYTHQVMRTWKVVPDGSVSGGCEVVSPVMQGNEGLDEIRTVMKVLRDAGARINASCGMHIHIGVDSLTREQQAELITLHQLFQPAFDALLTERRIVNNRRWAKKRNASEAQTASDAWEHGSSTERDYQSRQSDRYRALNINSYYKYGTYEFRSHQGSLNGKNATAWIVLHLALIELIRNGATQSLFIPLQTVAQDFQERDFYVNVAGHATANVEARVGALKYLVNVLESNNVLASDAAEYLRNRAGNVPVSANARNA